MTDRQIEERFFWLLVSIVILVVHVIVTRPVISDLEKRVEQLEAKCCAENGGLDNE